MSFEPLIIPMKVAVESFVMPMEVATNYDLPVDLEILVADHNGEYEASDGTAWNRVEVDVDGAPSGTVEISSNGNYNIAAFAQAQVNVPGRDPNLYEKISSLTLSAAPNCWMNNDIITIDCTYIDTNLGMSGNYQGRSGNPGYKKVRLINLPATANFSCSYMTYGHSLNSNFEELELDGDLFTKNGVRMFNCPSLKRVTGGRINLSQSSDNSSFAANAGKLETILFVPSTINKSISFNGAIALSKESVISIANGLDETATGQRIVFDSIIKTTYGSVTGIVTAGIFSADLAGTITLTDFITDMKGWTLA